MIRLKLTIVFLLLIATVSFAQENPFLEIDKRVLTIPDSLEKSTESIASYIKKKFNTDTERIRAVYVWIAKNISYDVLSQSLRYTSADKEKLIQKVLNKKIGVCEDYALLFNDLALKLGIKSHIISGYTRQRGRLDRSSHAWCAAFIDNTWHLFDPTWGSGQVYYNKYVKVFDDCYFMAEPKEMIRSHMPFDPLWQLLEYPLTNKDFINENFERDTTRPYFNFTDSIAHFEKLDKVEKFKSSYRRVKMNGVINILIEGQLEYLDREIRFYQNHFNVEKFNLAIETYNEAVLRYNEYLIYRNNRFKPAKSKAEILQMLKAINGKLQQSEEYLRIKDPEKELVRSIIQARESIEQLFLQVREQQTFLEKYYKTQKD